MATHPIWTPTQAEIEATNVYALMQRNGFETYEALHAWSVNNPTAFWRQTTADLGVVYDRLPRRTFSQEAGARHPQWLEGAKLNIANSCFQKGTPKDDVIITRRHDGTEEVISRRELDHLSNRVANGLEAMGLKKGDGVAIAMPMTVEAVAAYFGIVKAGMVVVSIPDSVPPEQIESRLRIGQAKAIFTQSMVINDGKSFPMYEKVATLGNKAPPAIIIPAYRQEINLPLLGKDRVWGDFLLENEFHDSVSCNPTDATNIIFSSGTTGNPKGIPWNHLTPIKAASDGRWHQDIHVGDTVCWPTNLGWMMGPWLIYASMMNGGRMALYEGAPTEKRFGQFVETAGVTILGLVPSIVTSWRNTGATEGCDWSKIRCFSSSGAASNPDLYAWLMHLNQPRGVVKPVIEYCGGTEIGGGYVSGALIKPAHPARFSAKALGIDFDVLNDDGTPCAPGKTGEVFITSRSIGLSERLIGRGDHDEVYYPKGAPGRWHGDLMTMSHDDAGWISNGRAGDDLNLNGIKFGSAEIERTVNAATGVLETAAIGVPPPEGGEDRLVIYAVMEKGVDRNAVNPDILKREMAALIRTGVSPFASHVHDVVIVDALPRTPSNKVMHKDLRAQYKDNEAAGTLAGVPRPKFDPSGDKAEREMKKDWPPG
jgi:acetyl-CoA synthetase